MPATYTQEEQAKLDAWANAIRVLARQHRVAHRSDVGMAIKVIRRTLVTESLTAQVSRSTEYALTAGIPDEELLAIRTLIFN